MLAWPSSWRTPTAGGCLAGSRSARLHSPLLPAVTERTEEAQALPPSLPLPRLPGLAPFPCTQTLSQVLSHLEAGMCYLPTNHTLPPALSWAQTTASLGHCTFIHVATHSLSKHVSLTLGLVWG